MQRGQFEKYVAEALASIPQRFRKAMQNIAIVVEDEPSRELLAEMDTLGKEPVSDLELQRARNQIEAAFVWQQDSVFSRASVLGRYELLGSWRLLDDFLPKLRAVTAADLQRVAQRYFVVEHKNVSVLLPAPAAAAAGATGSR